MSNALSSLALGRRRLIKKSRIGILSPQLDFSMLPEGLLDETFRMRRQFCTILATSFSSTV